MPSPWCTSKSKMATRFQFPTRPCVTSSAAMARSPKTQKPADRSRWAWCFAPGRFTAVRVSPRARASRAVSVPPAMSWASAERSGRGSLQVDSGQSPPSSTAARYASLWTRASSSRVAGRGAMVRTATPYESASSPMRVVACTYRIPLVGWAGPRFQFANSGV